MPVYEYDCNDAARSRPSARWRNAMRRKTVRDAKASHRA